MCLCWYDAVCLVLPQIASSKEMKCHIPGLPTYWTSQQDLNRNIDDLDGLDIHSLEEIPWRHQRKETEISIAMERGSKEK